MASADEPQETDLDDLVRRVDPDRWLSSRYISDAAARADVVALYAFDHELARAPRVSNPLLGEIRLTWWREALEEIFEERPIRRHPGVQALAAAIRRRALPRDGLERLIEARYRELDATVMDEAEALAWARDSGGELARLAAALLDPATDAGQAVEPGAAWALARRVAKQGELKPLFGRTLGEARRAARRLSVTAFPAVAHAALAAARARGAEPGQLGRQLRVLAAVARGRI